MNKNEYSSETKISTDPVLIKMPKNVRQIGQVDNLKKIYIEDYVMTYLKQVGIKKNTEGGVVILLGQFTKVENCQYIFISGAIEIKDVAAENNLILTNEIWNKIYDNINTFFTNVEIVGWGMIKPGLPVNADEKIRKIHIENFAGEDKVLLLYDSLERDEGFYIYEGNKLRKQTGYYIYYDKNPEMQNYMINVKRGKGVENHNVQNRYIVSRQPELVKKRKTVGSKGLLYVVGVGVSAVALVVCVGMFTGNSIFNSHKNPKEVMSENLITVEPQTENSILPVETVRGTLSSIDNSDKKEAITQQSSETPSVIPSETPSVIPSETPSIIPSEKPESIVPSPQKESESEQTVAQQERTSSKNSSYKTYIIKKGDTLVTICKRLNKTNDYIAKIQEINNINDTDKIIEGQKILLP